MSWFYNCNDSWDGFTIIKCITTLYGMKSDICAHCLLLRSTPNSWICKIAWHLWPVEVLDLEKWSKCFLKTISGSVFKHSKPCHAPQNCLCIACFIYPLLQCTSLDQPIFTSSWYGEVQWGISIPRERNLIFATSCIGYFLEWNTRIQALITWLDH